jgi:hypothetical protein
VSAPSAADAGSNFNVIVTATDNWGNQCNSTVTLRSSDGFAQTLTLANGTATASVTDLNNSGHTLVLTATTPGGLSGATTMTINPAAPARHAPGWYFSASAWDQYSGTQTDPYASGSAYLVVGEMVFATTQSQERVNAAPLARAALNNQAIKAGYLGGYYSSMSITVVYYDANGNLSFSDTFDGLQY